MTHPPLKRHASLQPLSRDHYVGLLQAQRLLSAAAGDAAARRTALDGFLAAWEAEISIHFSDEERLLADLIPNPGQRRRLWDDHAQLRSLAADAADQREHDAIQPDLLCRLGQLLNDHIRWEERELFPAIEQAAKSEQLARLESQTHLIEENRPRSACQTRLGAQ